MSIPTIRGQYRRIRYTDDGCAIYQCLWCKNRVEIQDDPNWWNFCPICGKSWFTRLQCRDHDMPKWAWDRFGDEHQPYYKHRDSEYQWVIEERIKWPTNRWGEWHYEICRWVDFGTLGSWRIAQQQLNMCRARVVPADGIEFEYRARIEKIDLTTSLSVVY